MKAIPLIGGDCTWVDDEDYERFSGMPWRSHSDRDGTPYVAIHVFKRWIWLHREILQPSDDLLVDHRNGNTLDNVRTNLRIVTPSQNQQNITSSKNQKKGGFKGVSWDSERGLWKAQIRIPTGNGGRGRKVALGRFSDPIEAAKAYDEASRRYHTHGCQNFPR